MNARIWIAVTAVQTAVILLALGLLVTHAGLAAPAPAPRVTAPAPAPAQQVPLAATTGLTLAEARAVIEGATARARELGGRMVVVVLDGMGNTISMDRMDDASYHLDRQAAGKARIAVMQRARSTDTSRLLDTRPDRYFGVLSLFPGEIYWVGVGVSGLPEGEDDMAADAGVAAWERFRATQRR